MKTTFSKTEIADWNLNFTTAKNFAFQNLSAIGISKIKSDRSFSDILRTSLSLNFATTIVALLLEAVSHPSAPLSRIAEHFIDSFIYANCIGILLGFSIFGLSPRIVLLRFPWNWALFVGIIFGVSLVGSFAAGSMLMAIGVFPAGDYSWIDGYRIYLHSCGV